uniref:Putative ovule protein n=1 Tax=Solanum chacoense TaxID=4108 RepID=A0A0V0GU06_SOLCH
MTKASCDFRFILPLLSTFNHYSAACTYTSVHMEIYVGHDQYLSLCTHTFCQEQVHFLQHH